MRPANSVKSLAVRETHGGGGCCTCSHKEQRPITYHIENITVGPIIIVPEDSQGLETLLSNILARPGSMQSIRDH